MVEEDYTNPTESTESKISGILTIPVVGWTFVATLKEQGFTPQPPETMGYQRYGFMSAGEYFRAQLSGELRALVEQVKKDISGGQVSPFGVLPSRQQPGEPINYGPEWIKAGLRKMYATSTTPITEDMNPGHSRKIRNYARIGITPEIIGLVWEKLIGEPFSGE